MDTLSHNSVLDERSLNTSICKMNRFELVHRINCRSLKITGTKDRVASLGCIDPVHPAHCDIQWELRKNLVLDARGEVVEKLIIYYPNITEVILNNQVYNN